MPLAKLVNLLMSDKAIRRQVLISLETNHIHNCIRRHYENVFHNSSNDELEDIPMIVRDKSNNRIIQRRNAQMISIYNADDRSRWDWHGIPARFKVIVIYQYLSTLYMIYVLMKNLFTDFVEKSVMPIIPLEWIPPWPLHCILIGRFQIQRYKIINTVTGNLAALANLLWPFFQWNRNHRMTLPYFLLFTTKDLDRYYKLIDDERRKVLSLASANNDFNEQSYGTYRNSKAQVSGHDHNMRRSSDQIEKFFHEVMSHTIPAAVTGQQRDIIQLRPNRTREANRKLRRLTASLSASYTTYIMLNAILLSFFIIKEILDDRRYSREYQGCDSSIEGSVHGQDYFSLTLTWHRLMTILFDLTENVLLWVETGTIAYGIEFSVILNYDLILYWRHLHNKSIKLSNQLKLMNFDRPTGSVKPTSAPITGLPITNFNPSINGHIVAGDGTDNPNGLMRSSLLLMPRSEIELNFYKRMEEKIRKLQFEIHDFIKEIKKADIFLSDILTVALSIWVGIFTSYVFVAPNGLIPIGTNPQERLRAAREGWIHIIILTVPMILVTVILLALLTLHRYCMKTYPIICTLMAHHQSLNKTAFIPILDSFLERRTCYRLFRLNPFLPTTFLSLIGWSFSCFFIVRGLMRDH